MSERIGSKKVGSLVVGDQISYKACCCPVTDLTPVGDSMTTVTFQASFGEASLTLPNSSTITICVTD